MNLHSFRPLLALGAIPLVALFTACSSSDPAADCEAPQPDAGAAETAADADVADAADASADAAADAADTGVKSPAHAVSSLAVAAGKAGAVVAYELRCEGCNNPWLGGAVEARALHVGLAPTDAGKVTQLVDPAERKGGARAPTIVSASSIGDDFHVLYEGADASLQLLGGAIPGGAIVSARLSTNLTVAKQTQGATFGEKVNAGFVTSAASDDAWLAAYDGANKDVLSAVRVQAGAVTDTRAGSASALTGSLFFPPGAKAPVAAYSSALPGADGDVTATVGGGSVAVPVRGVPVAVWGNGSGAGRAAIQQADGSLWIWDGKTLLRGPRADESACSAVTFDAAGNAIVAQVGPRSTVLYVQKEADLLTPTLLARDTTPIDLARVRSEYGINEQGIKRCGVATSGSVVYVAWSEPVADASGREVGLPNEIDVIAYDRATVSNVLKTKHDTAKNSINNVR